MGFAFENHVDSNSLTIIADVLHVVYGAISLWS